jgi:lipopolysaccharide export system permease protein
MFVFVTKFIVQYIGKIFGKGLSLFTIIEFVYLNLAWMLALAVPMSVLIASLMAFGRLSSDNEITILKSSGINLFQILKSTLGAAIILTIVMIIYNDRVLPEFNHRARLLFHSISQKKPTLDLEEGIYLQIGNFNILVQDIEKPLEARLSKKSDILGPSINSETTDKLKNITIFDHSSYKYVRIIIGDHGALIFDKSRESLVLTLFDGEIHEINTKDHSEYRRVNFTKNKFYIPAPELVFRRKTDDWRGDREMTIGQMQDEIEIKEASINRQLEEIKKQLQNYIPIPDSLTKSMMKNSVPVSRNDVTEDRSAKLKALRKTQGTAQQILAATTNIDHFEKQIFKFKVEVHKKFSIPFACIVFVLIGAPLGIKARKGSFGVGFTFSVGFFLLYWVCLIGGEELADRQILIPALAMWFPNIVVGSAGLVLTYRTLQETKFFNWEKLPKFLQTFFKGE